MNRRKAIFQISVAGAAIIGAAGGYKWLSMRKTPNLELLSANINLLSALAETIIPKTDTPGAAEAGVGKYIYIMIRDCTDKIEQNNFIDGLQELQAYTFGKYAKGYEDCDADQQESVLEHFESKGNRLSSGIIGKVKHKYLGRSFFSILKSYTVEGYFTSEAGATKALAYSLVPGSYQGCVNLTPGQKAWATN